MSTGDCGVAAAPTWTESEQELLRASVEWNGRDWGRAAMCLGRWTAEECRARWELLARFAIELAWTAEEDALLLRAVDERPTKRWSIVACRVPGRTAKECFERFYFYLRPRDCAFAAEDDALILHALSLGKRWPEIARSFAPDYPVDAVRTRVAHLRLRQTALLDLYRARTRPLFALFHLYDRDRATLDDHRDDRARAALDFCCRHAWIRPVVCTLVWWPRVTELKEILAYS